jgi:hypothetical protein
MGKLRLSFIDSDLLYIAGLYSIFDCIFVILNSTQIVHGDK